MLSQLVSQVITFGFYKKQKLTPMKTEFLHLAGILYVAIYQTRAAVPTDREDTGIPDIPDFEDLGDHPFGDFDHEDFDFDFEGMSKTGVYVTNCQVMVPTMTIISYRSGNRLCMTSIRIC